jgi:hypothetical protein
MAKRTTKGTAKRAKKKASSPKRTKAPKARASRAKQKSPAKKKSTSVTAAATAAASTVMDRLRAWSPSRYSMR